jgi:5,10-methylene-tetrahydrofolate dehydrogenase/methenyl tetrahydrofolate cyclohydrolase
LSLQEADALTRDYFVRWLERFAGYVRDVDYAAAEKVAGFITPVPGGVGATTIVCLMRNTLIAAALQSGVAVPDI